ncbi:MAG: TrmH family RNA methyltransferase [Candidatus Microsaccharimonas sossegonensis]|uniref:TrmH family RNA methyltransferase n=1 Tax=Candidatus Microsaccharimonas sossegonensis TaxID=2506948 RepID=A0A4Q0AIB7_9BACT|nr:MAG: TrmH family RNA methyltransferase [Candidatus Microsaccharimonas sossegonensis]
MQKEFIGVGPHPEPWPTDLKFDRTLLKEGDNRNVLDIYRYWTVAAIKADLDMSRHDLEIAIENLQRDYNMGTIVRAANAFNVKKVHIIGRKQWNKRGAMVTDLYMNIQYHDNVRSFAEVMKKTGREMIAVDIVAGAKGLSGAMLPANAVLIFGAEGPGLSQEMLATAKKTVMIEQFGSTRSVNVGVAAGIAMYVWLQQHALTR